MYRHVNRWFQKAYSIITEVRRPQTSALCQSIQKIHRFCSFAPHYHNCP
ncbi:hypothetical protein ROSEINA2194_02228 [Roseburia inulinivorans DSM 16841]|uniref:Uncharacterized protein n=1 Tax=Roseburia inulinivorans DSM 16841 TaxID=622312 RepID=C0FU07_9FIRM|nr:hypothetical protein ROSEINA2194_02228 [Roseburia inulinivorans DSM 16841]